jgi:hypothetical protein
VKVFSVSLTMSLAVLLSCLLWIGGISWVVVASLGLPASAGWLIASTLGTLAVAAIGLLIYEVRHAIDLPDDVDLDLFDPNRRDSFSKYRPTSSKRRPRRVSQVLAL